MCYHRLCSCCENNPNMQISSSIRTNIESKRQVRYELMNPTSIRRKRPGESKQSKRARARAKQARIRKEVEEERCKERERLSRIINAARLPYIKKSEEKKPSMPRSHNYRRKVLITKNNQRNYYKNKSSLLGRNLHYYRLCVFVSRTRRVKGKGRKTTVVLELDISSICSVVPIDTVVSPTLFFFLNK